MLNKILFMLCAIIVLGGGVIAYDYYYGSYGGTVDIYKTFSPTLLNQIKNENPEIHDITTQGQITLLECGSLSEYECRKLAGKIEEIVTKLCLDRNGIVSVEVNAQGNIIRTVGDTSCLT